MGSLRLTLCTGAVVAAALTGSASSAHAADSGGVSVVPASPVPGSDIQVRAKGCGGRSGTATSKAFVANAQLTQLTGKDLGTLAGETRVRSSLGAGTYDVRITCDGREGKLKGTITVGDLAIDLAGRRVHLDGTEVDLTPREFDLLVHLAERPGEVVTKRDLLVEVWRQPWGGSDKTVDVHLSWLRRKLGETAAAPRYLTTVRGVGVRLAAPDPTPQDG